MRTKRFIPLTAWLLSLAITLSLSGYLPVGAKTQGQLEQELERLEEQEKEIKQNISDTKSDLNASKKRKDLLDTQIGNVTQQIDLLNEQLNRLDKDAEKKSAEIAQAEKDITAKEEAIRSTHEQLGQRLREIAKSGNLSAIQRLLNTDNYTEYLLKSKAAECIARRDQQTMDQLEAALADIQQQKTQLEQQKKDIEANRAEKEALKKKSNTKKKELDTLHSAVQSEVRDLQSNLSDYNDELKETQKKIEEANAAIEAMIKNSASTGTYDNSMMYWPVPTVRAISSYFGPRWGTMHRGLDIANGPIPIYGQNIVAAADGVVIAANYTSRWGSGWSYGYGYSCIIDHGTDSRGRKIHTLYAHCSKLFAREGQKVVGGQTVLGQAGNTGDVTGPHLHFEVRVDGVRVNPYGTYVRPDVN